MGNLVKVGDNAWLDKFVTESKGPNSALTIKAVESLTVKIDQRLDRRYTPPPPGKHLSDND